MLFSWYIYSEMKFSYVCHCTKCDGVNKLCVGGKFMQSYGPTSLHPLLSVRLLQPGGIPLQLLWERIMKFLGLKLYTAKTRARPVKAFEVHRGVSTDDDDTTRHRVAEWRVTASRKQSKQNGPAAPDENSSRSRHYGLVSITQWSKSSEA